MFQLIFVSMDELENNSSISRERMGGICMPFLASTKVIEVAGDVDDRSCVMIELSIIWCDVLPDRAMRGTEGACSHCPEPPVAHPVH